MHVVPFFSSLKNNQAQGHSVCHFEELRNGQGKLFTENAYLKK
jgi:hypothetical protein